MTVNAKEIKALAANLLETSLAQFLCIVTKFIGGAVTAFEENWGERIVGDL